MESDWVVKGKQGEQHSCHYAGRLNSEKEVERSNIHLIMEDDRALKGKWREATFISLWRETKTWKEMKEKQRSCLYGGWLGFEREASISDIHDFMEGDWFLNGKEGEAIFMFI